MSQPLEKYGKKLPSINELYSNDLEVLDKQNDLNILLNQEPKKDWIKGHPVAKVERTINGQKTKIPIKYLPIERIEWLLTNIFIQWRWEILREGLIANSVYVAGRLHYRNPVTGEWDYMDGIGAQPLQTDSGAGATDFNKVKSNAVQIGLPAAESYAQKDAAEKLGKLFGKDLNRADEIGYNTLVGKFEPPQPDITQLKKQLIEILDKREDKIELKKQMLALQNEGKLTLEVITSWIEKYK